MQFLLSIKKRRSGLLIAIAVFSLAVSPFVFSGRVQAQPTLVQQCSRVGDSCQLPSDPSGQMSGVCDANLACVVPPGGTQPSGSTEEPKVPEGGPQTIEELFTLFVRAVMWLLVFGVLIAIAGVIFGGIRYVTGGGSADAASAGTRIVVFALIGIGVILLAVVLVDFVANTLGVEVPKKIIESFGGN